MNQAAAPIHPEIADGIRRLANEHLRPFGLKGIDVRAGEDHDGEPSIYVDARYSLSKKPIEPKVLSNLQVAIWRMLSEKGETRFPYIRHHFADEQKVAGYV